MVKILKKDEINEGVKALKEGKLVAFPTETVFGLAAISTSEEAFNRLVETKKRPPNKPFTLMCSSIDDISTYAKISPLAEKIIKKFMPGPLTIILKAKENVKSYIDLGSGFVGFRIPDDDFVRKLIKEVGAPLLVPSANKSSEPPAKSDAEVVKAFENDDVLVFEGACNEGVPSTIIKIDSNNIILIRKGPIPLEEIEEAAKMKISLGSDHGGYIYKEEVKKHLIEKGYEVIDCGTNSKESCNYAEFGIEAAKKVANKEADFGVVICSSGEGICMAANKVKGIRCGIGYNDDVATLLREHNDANMISFGAKFMDLNDVIRRIDIFLKTDFEGGRHEKRVETIKNFEK